MAQPNVEDVVKAIAMLPSILELARFAAAMQQLKDAREAFNLLNAGGADREP